MVVVFSVLQSCYCMICFLIGFCWTMISFGEDIEIELSTLNDAATKYSSKIKINLVNIIQFHSKAKQLSSNSIFFLKQLCHNFSFEKCRFVFDFLDINEVIILIYFLWSISTICSTLLVIQMEIVEYLTI